MSEKAIDKQQQRRERLAKLKQIKESSSSGSESRSRSRDKEPVEKQGKKQQPKIPEKDVNNALEGEQNVQNKSEYAEEDEMARMLGFSGFGSSKNKDHSKSSCEAIYKNSQARRQYRQYMNRRGGFDRKLDKM